jgi:Rrf2 family protein
MEITRRTDYAIRILMELAKGGEGATISVRSIADRQQVPYAFARGIQRDLVVADLVRSRRGATGGISLARPAAEISLLDVIQAVQGPIATSMCTTDPGWCARMGGCSVHSVWREADRLESELFASKDLASLVSPTKRSEEG